MSADCDEYLMQFYKISVHRTSGLGLQQAKYVCFLAPCSIHILHGDWLERPAAVCSRQKL